MEALVKKAYVIQRLAPSQQASGCEMLSFAFGVQVPFYTKDAARPCVLLQAPVQQKKGGQAMEEVRKAPVRETSLQLPIGIE